MDIHISKTDLAALFRHIDKCAEIIKAKEPTPREYNAARQLLNLKRGLIRKNKLTNF